MSKADREGIKEEDIWNPLLDKDRGSWVAIQSNPDTQGIKKGMWRNNYSSHLDLDRREKKYIHIWLV